jgi:hypothetical protein
MPKGFPDDNSGSSTRRQPSWGNLAILWRTLLIQGWDGHVAESQSLYTPLHNNNEQDNSTNNKTTQLCLP